MMVADSAGIGNLTLSPSPRAGREAVGQGFAMKGKSIRTWSLAG